MITIDDIEDRKEPVLIDNFMSDFYCDAVLQRAKTSGRLGGMLWSHTTIVDDHLGSFAKLKSVVSIEDENTSHGQGLSCDLEAYQLLASPLGLRTIEHEKSNIGVINTSVYVTFGDSSFDRDKYHPPRASVREPGVKTLTLFLEDTDGEVILFDKSYIGAKPKGLAVKHRYSCKKGTALIFDGNKFYSTLPPTKGNMYYTQLHYIDGEDGAGRDLGFLL